MADVQVNLYIKRYNGFTFAVRTRLESTVADFKGLLSTNYGVVAAENHLLNRDGNFFEDRRPLSFYGLRNGHRVFLLPVSEDINGHIDNILPSISQVLDAAFHGLEGQAGIAEVRRHLEQNVNRSRHPLYPHILEIILNYPQVYTLITSNPRSRDVARDIDRMATLYTGPSIRRQILDVTRNPLLRPQVSENLGRAIRNAGITLLR